MLHRHIVNPKIISIAAAMLLSCCTRDCVSGLVGSTHAWGSLCTSLWVSAIPVPLGHGPSDPLLVLQYMSRGPDSVRRGAKQEGPPFRPPRSAPHSLGTLGTPYEYMPTPDVKLVSTAHYYPCQGRTHAHQT